VRGCCFKAFGLRYPLGSHQVVAGGLERLLSIAMRNKPGIVIGWQRSLVVPLSAAKSRSGRMCESREWSAGTGVGDGLIALRYNSHDQQRHVVVLPRAGNEMVTVLKNAIEHFTTAFHGLN